MKRQFDAACWTADMILIPLVGVVFVALSLGMATFEQFTFNGQLVRYSDSPGKFTAIVLGGVAMGLGCCAYGALRYWMTRSRISAASPPPG